MTPQSEKTPEEIAAAARANAKIFASSIPADIDPARRILEQYSGIAAENVDAHLLKIREKAWSIFPYGCIGSFSFLNLEPTLSDPLFRTITTRLLAPGSTETFLDVGCCFGQVIRQLIHAGVPSERLYGTDLQPRFLELGYDLFCDGDLEKSRATYVAGDMLADEDDAALDGLQGKIDIVYAASFFHLFEPGDQLKAAKRVVGFLRSGNPDVVIFGRNGGPKVEGWEKYVLDAKQWRRLWEEVGEATGTRWRTEMETEEGDDWIKVRFAVYRDL
ncbi:hypothetical protein QBC34DRAFT_484552 [Podospora aff. communis PSN243]|uniref:Methyltransferase domain-containing protein n=1 Tax=Podospora aff. communis PSN243 TaxID=3040156 RepID=A0AAV9GQ51_9PEZI|nr:hypothetical protein QBC34DRAFT_484552 [Podospora aff. communis PSN243]